MPTRALFCDGTANPPSRAVRQTSSRCDPFTITLARFLLPSPCKGTLLGCKRGGGMSQGELQTVCSTRKSLAFQHSHRTNGLRRDGIVKFGRRLGQLLGIWSQATLDRLGLFEQGGGRPRRQGHIRRGCDLFHAMPCSSRRFSFPKQARPGFFRRGISFLVVAMREASDPGVTVGRSRGGNR